MREVLSLLCGFKDYSLTSAIYDLRSVKTGANPFGSKRRSQTKAFHLCSTHLIFHQNTSILHPLLSQFPPHFLASFAQSRLFPNRQGGTQSLLPRNGVLVITAQLDELPEEYRCHVPSSTSTVKLCPKWFRKLHNAQGKFQPQDSLSLVSYHFMAFWIYLLPLSFLKGFKTMYNDP